MDTFLARWLLRLGTKLSKLVTPITIVCLVIPLNIFSKGVLAASDNHIQEGILLGSYVKGYLNQATVNNELIALDNWSGKHTSLAGVFYDFEAPGQNHLPEQMEVLWQNGYTPFINLNFGYVNQPTAADIASGAYDAAITSWAQYYNTWAGNTKTAFIALLPEMNLPWISYGDDSAQYILAYRHIQDIFKQVGVLPSAVRWVFAPNGWSHHPYEKYYPGDDVIDIIGFSSFNFGYCSIPANQDAPGWDGPEIVLGPFIRDMHKMAPTKPIFITRIGTSAYTAKNVTDTNAKNEWLHQAYAYLEKQPAVKAVLYYNYDVAWDCDWPVYQGAPEYDGYKTAISSSAFVSLTPDVLKNTSIEIRPPEVTVSNGIYLPMIVHSNSTINDDKAVILGVYPGEWPGTHRILQRQVNDLGEWAGKPLTIVGTFIDVMADPDVFIELQLETIADNDYTPFVNLNTIPGSGITAADIASGEIDANIRAAARAFANYARGGSRMAFLAPLQEMNISAIPYGRDPENYKLAFYRFQRIFAEEGVPDRSIRWVFAPNGSNAPGDPDFEAYYPGDEFVDVVSFSTYHYGFCPWAPTSWQGWQSKEAVVGSYYQRMYALAPTKPIFISQTATSSYSSSHNQNLQAKDEWILDSYRYASNLPNVKAIIYFNWDYECDWAFYRPNGPSNPGFQKLSQDPIFKYISPTQLMQLYAP